MSRLLVTIFHLLAIVSFGLCTNTCGSAPASCSRLSAAATKSCSILISSKKLQKSVCTRPSTTITKTAFVTPRTTTVTSWTTLVKTTAKTAYSTSYNTAIVTSTKAVESSVTIPVTVQTAVTITTTATTTTSIPYERESCIAARGLQRRHELPRDCSCFLTSTSLCGKVTSTITETGKAPTATVTSTKTLTRAVDSIIATTIRTTDTTVSTTTNVATQTDTTVVTSTVTETALATATTMEDPCETPHNYSTDPFTGSNTQLRIRRDSNTLSDCCRSCFDTIDCVFYIQDPQRATCEVYVAKEFEPGRSCATKSCPKGNNVGLFQTGSRDGRTYGVGPCGTGAQK